MNRETLLMNRMMAALAEEGCFVLRSQAGVFYTKTGQRVKIGFPGLSDLVGCTPEGKFFAIEVKLPGEKPRENQYQFLEKIRSLGGYAGWATTIEEALTIIDRDRTQ